MKIATMRIYFYHTQDIQMQLARYARGEFPGHLLYGATHLGEYDIDVVWHRFMTGASRLRNMLVTAWRVLRLGNKIDAVYATHYRGIEILVFMRALGLFGKPIVIWHHQPVVKSTSWWREKLGKTFYRGIDEMFFFSQKLIDDSEKVGKVNPEKFHLGHWGADLDFYDHLLSRRVERTGFVSSGKEMRDMPTLVGAFNETGALLDVYLNHVNGDINYRDMFSQLHIRPNINVCFTNDMGMGVPEIAAEVDEHQCVVICCQETKYTVGLTTLVEALALGMPILCSRNPQFPVDVDREGCGISIPYYNKEGWIEAITYAQNHPDELAEMGKRGRKLAERLYNDRHCAEEVARVLHCVMQRESSR